MALLGLSILIASLSYLIYTKLHYRLFALKAWNNQQYLESRNAQAPIIITDDDQTQDKPTEKEKQADVEDEDEDEDRRMMPPPALPSATRKIGSHPANGSLSPSGASRMTAPTSKPSFQLATSPACTLSVPRQPTKTNLSPSLTLRPSPARPGPNRLRPSTTTLSVPRAPPPSSLRPTTPTAAAKRKPVILTLGHSPLDWARLQDTPGNNLRGLTAPGLIPVPPSLLARHNKRHDAWAAFGGRVYNVTPYLEFHPGGVGELMRAAGRDGTRLFTDVHPWVSWETMLRACEVGVLVGEREGDEGGGGWEEMD
ncbi:MAG: hypothetical protein M1816_000385 [Peltula sp. TS41687]|nr:MAG: hypothetical protein M1816_000385 [Peltula sp. TS41687]